MRSRMFFSLLILTIATLGGPHLAAQTDSAATRKSAALEKPAKNFSAKFLVAWWNVENLYDPTRTSDAGGDFTPKGKQNWTQERLTQKFKNLAQVIKDMSKARGFDLPDVMGFGGVSRQWLLDTLFQKYLNARSYRTVYYESPDERGLDVGIVFNAAKFQLDFSSNYTVKLDSGDAKTRDIVLAKLDYQGRILSVVCTHWNKPISNLDLSEEKRVKAARLLRGVINSLSEGEKDKPKTEADIVVLGDFNDTPDAPTITDALRAVGDTAAVVASQNALLYNFAARYSGVGTYYFRGKWQRLDQAMVSKGMFDAKAFFVEPDGFACFSAPYLYEASRRSEPFGKPLPTYSEQRYLGGYSDHLPISLIVYFK